MEGSEAIAEAAAEEPPAVAAPEPEPESEIEPAADPGPESSDPERQATTAAIPYLSKGF